MKTRVRFTITIVEDLMKRTKVFAVKNDRTYSDVIEKSLIEYLRNNE